MHLNSRLAFRRYAMPFFANGQRVLELGPDGNPSVYRNEVQSLELDWETADLAGHLMPAESTFRPGARTTYVMADEYSIPVADASFDVVISGQVIEHVRAIWTWMRELARVTRPGGHVVVISPISWPYHAAPIDCWRIYPEGMRALCADAGLTVDVCEQVALERRPSKRTYFAESWEYQLDHDASAVKGKLKELIGWPMPTALDLVTVATK